MNHSQTAIRTSAEKTGKYILASSIEVKKTSTRHEKVESSKMSFNIMNNAPGAQFDIERKTLESKLRKIAVYAAEQNFMKSQMNMYGNLAPELASTALRPEDIRDKRDRLLSGRSDSRLGSSGRKPPHPHINQLSHTSKGTSRLPKSDLKPPRIRSAMPQMRRKVQRVATPEKEVLSHKENKINIKTANRVMMPERSCLSSKSRSTAGLMTNRSSKEMKKTRFEDDQEESKYKVYIKHVTMLNQMKQYLQSMHKTMSKEVIKKLVVSIKKMEQELVFYENNWHLFNNPNFDENKESKPLNDDFGEKFI